MSHLFHATHQVFDPVPPAAPVVPAAFALTGETVIVSPVDAPDIKIKKKPKKEK